MSKNLPISANWYLFTDIRHRRFKKAVWVPLRACETLISTKSFGELGYIRETCSSGSLAVPVKYKNIAEELDWSRIGLIHSAEPYCGPEGYKRTDEYWLDWPPQGRSGLELVLPQSFDSEALPEWQLNQDLVFALRLSRESDVWVRPEEGYIDVVRLERDSDGRPIKMGIRAEHLRDYLAAREMALRLVWYRDRDSIISNIANIPWAENGISENEKGFRLKARAFAVHEGTGNPFGAKSAYFHVSRTDIDPEEDVPEFGLECDENTESTSRIYSDGGARLFRVEGEIWAEEWIDPSVDSIRVRGDKRPSSTSFIVDASGSTQSADDLNNEDIGKYLWFRPDIIPDLLTRRGVSWRWYTLFTGGIELTPGYHVHFGLNKLGLVNIYAYDIAKLPEWQRRIWLGFNRSPEGGVSKELLQVQMKAQPPSTLAPEEFISAALKDLNARFLTRFELDLFRSHPSREAISKSIHRFRALDQSGVFALAKDISRIFVEGINSRSLHSIVAPKKGEPTGSLKSLERVLATIVDTKIARDALTALVGIYELRGADAHLPAGDLNQAFRMAAIKNSSPPFEQGLQMLMSVMRTIVSIYKLLETSSKSK